MPLVERKLPLTECDKKCFVAATFASVAVSTSYLSSLVCRWLSWLFSGTDPDLITVGSIVFCIGFPFSLGSSFVAVR